MTQAGIDALRSEERTLRQRLSDLPDEKSSSRDDPASLDSLRTKALIREHLNRVSYLVGVVTPAPMPIGTDEVAFGHMLELARTRMRAGRDSPREVFSALIGGEYEPDLYENVKNVSNASPLGKKLRGLRIGDVVDLETPEGLLEYEILSISVPDSARLQPRKDFLIAA